MIPINQRIIGQWKFNSNFTGSHQSRYSGTITFNQDGSLLDTDSLLSSGSKNAPVLKKLYNVKGDTLRLVTITSKDTTVAGGVVTTKECNQLVFGSWFYDMVLKIRTRNFLTSCTMNQSQRPKRKYTAEFKADVLRLVANGEPIMAVARKMGISDSLIHAWRKTNDKGEKKTDQSLQQEVDSLRKQLRQSEMEREILKKAVAIFSRQT